MLQLLISCKLLIMLCAHNYVERGIPILHFLQDVSYLQWGLCIEWCSIQEGTVCHHPNQIYSLWSKCVGRPWSLQPWAVCEMQRIWCIQNEQLLSYCSVSTPFHFSSNIDLIWMCVCTHIDLLESVIMYIHMCTCTGSLMKRRPSVILVLTFPLGMVQETALEWGSLCWRQRWPSLRLSASSGLCWLQRQRWSYHTSIAQQNIV